MRTRVKISRQGEKQVQRPWGQEQGGLFKEEYTELGGVRETERCGRRNDLEAMMRGLDLLV